MIEQSQDAPAKKGGSLSDEELDLVGELLTRADEVERALLTVWECIQLYSGDHCSGNGVQLSNGIQVHYRIVESLRMLEGELMESGLIYSEVIGGMLPLDEE